MKLVEIYKYCRDKFMHEIYTHMYIVHVVMWIMRVKHRLHKFLSHNTLHNTRIQIYQEAHFDKFTP